MGIVNHTNYTTQEKSFQPFCIPFRKVLGNMDIPDHTFLYTFRLRLHFHNYSFVFSLLHKVTNVHTFASLFQAF